MDEACGLWTAPGGGELTGYRSLQQFFMQADVLQYIATIPADVSEIYVVIKGSVNSGNAASFNIFGYASSGQMSFGTLKPLHIVDFGNSIVINTCRLQDNLATSYKASVSGNDRDIIINFSTVPTPVSGDAYLEFYGR